MAQVRLRELSVGTMARVTGIRDTHRSYRSKLLSMGLTRGTPLVVERIAPLGDPVHVTVRGFGLSLRGDEADALVLEHLEGRHEDYGFSPRYGRRGRRHLRLRLRRHGRRGGEAR